MGLASKLRKSVKKATRSVVKPVAQAAKFTIAKPVAQAAQWTSKTPVRVARKVGRNVDPGYSKGLAGKGLSAASKVPGLSVGLATVTGGAALLNKDIRKSVPGDLAIGAAVGAAIAGGNAAAALGLASKVTAPPAPPPAPTASAAAVVAAAAPPVVMPQRQGLLARLVAAIRALFA